jgi:hypothetical protein
MSIKQSGRHSNAPPYPTQIAIPRKVTGTMPAIWLSQGFSGTTIVAPCSRCGNAGFDNHDRPEPASGSVTPCKRMHRFTGRQYRSSERSRRLDGKYIFLLLTAGLHGSETKSNRICHLHNMSNTLHLYYNFTAVCCQCQCIRDSSCKGLKYYALKFHGKHALGQNGEAATEPYATCRTCPYGMPALHDRCDASEQRRVVVTPATCPTHAWERMSGIGRPDRPILSRPERNADPPSCPQIPLLL